MNYTLIALCLLAFVWELSTGINYAASTWGAIPARLFGSVSANFLRSGDPGPAFDPTAWTTVLTSMFLHGSTMHLLGNMLFLYVFGDNVEDALGHGKYLVFYLLTGAAAALAHAYVNPASIVPMVGASGAISGVLAAYLAYYPRAEVTTLVPIFIFFRVLQVPAWLMIGWWFLLQVLLSAGDCAMTAARDGAKEGGGVAYLAHVGGFLAGFILVRFFRPRVRTARERVIFVRGR